MTLTKFLLVTCIQGIMEDAASVTDPKCRTDFLVQWLKSKVVYLADPQPGHLYK